MTIETQTDVLVVGGGASGLMAAIGAARAGKRVTICEKQSKPGLKILASGGERCNVTNTLDSETFMSHFGRHGRFMSPALSNLSNVNLIQFFADLGVETKSRDGFRVFPASHKSESVLEGLMSEVQRLGVDLRLNTPVENIEETAGGWKVGTPINKYKTTKVVMSTGGLTAPRLGTTGDGYKIAATLGHTIKPTHPGGVPLRTKETWPGKCRADTIGKARISVDMKKHRKISMVGDLIFTNFGIAGKLVLDLSAEITPLVEKYGEVPVVINLRPQLNQQNWQDLLTEWKQNPDLYQTLSQAVQKHLPASVAQAMCELVVLDPTAHIRHLAASDLVRLTSVLVNTPMTITGSQGFKIAFITRGGINLKEINPNTLESKVKPGLHFCGEVVDLNGPCGGYNLQWAFASGYLAGQAAARD